MHKYLLSAPLFALALGVPLAAQAHQAGDFIIRAGAATTAPNEESGNLKLDGTKVPGTKATLDSDTQLGLAFAYMLTDHVGLELLAATPFQHDRWDQRPGPGPGWQAGRREAAAADPVAAVLPDGRDV